MCEGYSDKQGKTPSSLTRQHSGTKRLSPGVAWSETLPRLRDERGRRDTNNIKLQNRAEVGGKNSRLLFFSPTESVRVGIELGEEREEEMTTAGNWWQSFQDFGYWRLEHSPFLPLLLLSFPFFISCLSDHLFFLLPSPFLSFLSSSPLSSFSVFLPFFTFFYLYFSSFCF